MLDFIASVSSKVYSDKARAEIGRIPTRKTISEDQRNQQSEFMKGNTYGMRLAGVPKSSITRNRMSIARTLIMELSRLERLILLFDRLDLTSSRIIFYQRVGV